MLAPASILPEAAADPSNPGGGRISPRWLARSGRAAAPLEGTWLGRYQILAPLGRGGMASVWLARGRPAAGEPLRLVALKTMLPDIAGSPEFRAMFVDEGNIERSIDHANVVRVLDAGESEGVLYLAMEWVEGGTFHALMTEAGRRGPIPVELAVRLVADAAAGLHAAHELRRPDGTPRGLVHCDVSPPNLLVGLDGVVKVLDFGVAKAMNETHGLVGGKTGYMSPEQALGHTLDRRSDVYSLGVVLYELTTGVRLFRGADARATLELVAAGRVTPPSAVAPGFPAELETIVLRALARRPGDRYSSAAEFRAALEAYLTDRQIVVPCAGIRRLVRRVLGDAILRRREEIAAVVRDLAERRRDRPFPGRPDASRAEATGQVTLELDVPFPAARARAWWSTTRAWRAGRALLGAALLLALASGFLSGVALREAGGGAAGGRAPARAESVPATSNR